MMDEVNKGNVGIICVKDMSRMGRDYLKVAKLKPFKYIAFIQILFILANTFYNSTLVFFARYELGVADDITSVIFLIAIISNLAFTPVAGVLSVRFDKHKFVHVRGEYIILSFP